MAGGPTTSTPSLARTARHLRCPQCAAGLTATERALSCPRGHTFDIARQGYVNLLAAPTGHSADTPAMVAARADFLASGHYRPLADALARRAAVAAEVPGCVLDVGGGTGYYLARVMAELPAADGVLLDLSKFAARRAARVHPRVGATVADAWAALPVRNGAAALALNVFAPRNGPELRRALHPRGALLTVTPRPGHLRELVDGLDLLRVDDAKDARVTHQLAPYFTTVATEELTVAMELDHHAVVQLVGMGPTARHVDPADLRRRVARLPEPCGVTLSVTLSEHRLAGDVPVDRDGDPAAAPGPRVSRRDTPTG